MSLNSREDMRCQRCHRISIQLIPITDDGQGIKICKPCKLKVLNKRMEEPKMVEKKEVTNKAKEAKVEKPKRAAMPIEQLSDQTAWIALSEKRLEQLGFNLKNTTREVREHVFKKLGIE